MRSGVFKLALCLWLPFVPWQPASAAVTFSCTVSASALAFGIYPANSAASVTTTGTFTVTCTATGTGSATVSGTLSLSTGSSGQFATRTMRAGTSVLDYNIYVTPAYSQIFGDGTAGTYELSESGTVTAGQIYQVGGAMYGLVPARQDVAPGSYVDTIVMTVTY
jgi:spore coat protein U domain-containing protein, fimbrial subunit CupE1/2/3/6